MCGLGGLTQIAGVADALFFGGREVWDEKAHVVLECINSRNLK